MPLPPPTLNPITPTIPLLIGGHLRHLRLDFNALARFEGETGIKVFGRNTWDLHSALVMRAMLWASLLHQDPDLELEEVGSWMLMGDARTILDALIKALNQSWPAPQEEAADEEAPLGQRRASPPPG